MTLKAPFSQLQSLPNEYDIAVSRMIQPEWLDKRVEI